jgi:hypothetical protein
MIYYYQKEGTPQQRKEMKVMANNNIKERIEKLEMQIFCLECKDHWTNQDWKEMDRMRAELAELKAQ